MISKPHGIIIVTGPTGSGKTTTLYTLLKELNNNQKKIMTIEDPVEYRMQGIVQHQIREKADFRFADAVRSFLRHDPDIILVGEIRDKETAEASIWAALTGHLVLSTLHTNDAVLTIVRLAQMGIEPYLICSTVLLVVSQRLVRRLCPACRIKKSYPSEYLQRFGFLSDMFKGPNLNMELYSTPDKSAHSKTTYYCKKCKDTGYFDRIALVEAMKMTEKIHESLHYNLPVADIKRTALEEGMITMKQDGLSKAYHGLTSLEEVISTTIS
ncbi:MAG: hypothetical protein A2Y62_14875 [Candidatus Fischerbacteria bacterium RBG_13_37_8]|uniref:Bacterial type II secretion system protein E domain-containing protein n=1 Tax=Candidatus Fischerbacteria bacterium RBG_13_37_8 TaxID=1817863 RepID=A0A1F5V511_9BACT|nr:MAG: hypothetical protein A2Y62_14875 [Candidatus Fischerbacteria bacterium RBG_13_37_8]